MLEEGLGRERRVFERVLARCPVKFKTDREDALAEGSSKDLSDAGLGLFSRKRLETDMRLEMWIKVSPQIKPLHIRGRVVWSDQKHPGLWCAGICFDKMAFIRIVESVVTKNLN